MTSFWSRRRTLITGSLTAALVAAITVLAGTAFGAARVNSGVSGVAQVSGLAKPAASPPQPTPASDQYGKPPGYKSKCALKADATYKAVVAKANTLLAFKLKHATSPAAKALAVKQYKAAVAAAKAKYKSSLKKC